MCGIVGYIGPKQSTSLLIGGLKRLEYRGYDSAGLAVLEPQPVREGAPGAEGPSLDLKVLRCRGKLSELEALVAREPPQGHVGIGHTRWATHGRPSDENAHPHCYKGVAVVHNGIIENYLELKQALSARGHEFQSETDTEIIAHLIWEELQRDPAPATSAQTPRSSAQRADRLLHATRRALHRVEGAYAIVVLSLETPEEIVCAKNSSPLVLGLGEGENFIASDVPALLEHTRRVVFLEEGDLAQVRSDGVRIIDLDGNERTSAQRPPRTITWSLVAAEKDGFKHFMLKEIHEQPRAVTDTLRGRLVHQPPDALLDGIDLGLPGTGLNPAIKVRRVLLLACGTSYHAALVGKYMIERLARLPVEVDLASEFRYRDPVLLPGDLAVSVSQSGETADTLAAVKEARQRGAQTLSIANVVDSSIPRVSHHALYTHAGPEIGVASTKAFTTQLSALFLLAVHLGRRTGALGDAAAAELVHELLAIPSKIGEAVETATQVQALARRFAHAQDVLYLGRGPQYPIALEGALKLKEISYIHAEGYAAGEMKHGPIALIDEGVPVIVLAPEEFGYEKVLSNLSEVKARGGQVIAIATRGDAALRRLADEVIEVPRAPSLLLPLITVVPLQLFAYHVADIKGTDVDQPRNLAKSVTVE
jgi:glucosamine--fructose-6-phosphate aminotransferase (isomerizing)